MSHEVSKRAMVCARAVTIVIVGHEDLVNMMIR
jgi:hypothetical protein